jgi:hypothetical protein
MIPRFLRPEVVPFASVTIIRVPARRDAETDPPPPPAKPADVIDPGAVR